MTLPGVNLNAPEGLTPKPIPLVLHGLGVLGTAAGSLADIG
jgi:hypothetical protein